MAAVSQLGYLGLSVSDPAKWEKFATETLGLAVSEKPEDGSLRLRMDDHEWRIAIHPGGNDDLAYIGWEVPDRETLGEVSEALRAAGTEVRHANDDQARVRGVFEMVTFRDPNGVASELFYGPMMARHEFVSPRGISGFKTGELGLGHVVMMVDDFEKSLDFYTRVLGMRISDFIDLADGRVRLGFMHCNPRHHTLAILQNPDPPKRINHFMLEVASVDDVGSTYDLCQRDNAPIVMSLGRHTNDHMLSFYMQNPSGFMVEYGWGARTVDDRTWQVQMHTSGSIWGHRPSAGGSASSAFGKS